MSTERKNFIAATHSCNWRNAYKIINCMTMKEMLWSLASIRRQVLEMSWREFKQCPMGTTVDVARIDYAVNLVMYRKLSKVQAKLAPSEANDVQNFLSGKSEHQLIFTEDPTGLNYMPAPNPSAARLSQADYDKAAGELGTEAAIIRTVAEVEANGAGFDGQGRPKIRYEAHWFQKNTGKKFANTHPHLSQLSQKGAAAYYVENGWDQWSLLFEAMTLDSEAAMKSVSWGMFQILGVNHGICGATLDAFVNGMFISEYMHLKYFMAYCTSRHLIKSMKDKRWADFASKYNGPNYLKYHYPTKLANAYAKHSKKPQALAKAGK
jgi:N-acetylmuramidase